MNHIFYAHSKDLELIRRDSDMLRISFPNQYKFVTKTKEKQNENDNRRNGKTKNALKRMV